MPGGETGHHGETYLRTACPSVKSLVGARLNVVMNKPHGIPTGVGDVLNLHAHEVLHQEIWRNRLCQSLRFAHLSAEEHPTFVQSF